MLQNDEIIKRIDSDLEMFSMCMEELKPWFKNDYCKKHQDEFMNWFKENILLDYDDLPENPTFDEAFSVVLKEYFYASQQYNKLLANKANLSIETIVEYQVNDSLKNVIND